MSQIIRSQIVGYKKEYSLNSRTTMFILIKVVFINYILSCQVYLLVYQYISAGLVSSTEWKVISLSFACKSN